MAHRLDVKQLDFLYARMEPVPLAHATDAYVRMLLTFTSKVATRPLHPFALHRWHVTCACTCCGRR